MTSRGKIQSPDMLDYMPSPACDGECPLKQLFAGLEEAFPMLEEAAIVFDSYCDHFV